MTVQTFYRFISLNIWGNLPSNFQRSISKAYANIYNKSFSKYVIKPYCKLNYKDPDYLTQFTSATGNEGYSSFQDFFTRVYKTPPKVLSEFIWPCEGLLCDYGKVSELPEINVKGDKKNVRAIFGALGSSIPDDYYFSNVFLHNNNYHRIHAPTNGIIKSIEHISGDLVMLRPWLYKNDPSLPAMRNERVNLTIEDVNGKLWYLSIVGGPAVGTIVLNEAVKLNAHINVVDEIGLFLLGSTCCIAAPYPTVCEVGETVYVGNTYCSSQLQEAF
ncbi:phosphatidylserine decarboxylase [Fulvivirga sp. RKSG066]|uniref:phosphatidylserine decarboxylase n=1 Tax=Fulvivirga aurantia TaxID=2529383 RepID=UPI0012BD4542|nr:phosphatidylserine decarboxylase [Fulvivirga aurantia]MTI20310.1 phosphatidylserine decarboxylase [Fulvivirga aurantia]